ncbi:hypothetical protein [Halopseudomonas pachastrellae]|nr:hypothetical protein [Halopseudomonas pachastrellae]
MNQQQWMLRERYYIGLLNALYTLKDTVEHMQAWYMEPGSEHRDGDINQSEGYVKLRSSAWKSFSDIKELHGPAELVVSGNAVIALKEFYSIHWEASEFSACNAEWIDKVHKGVKEAHKIVLREAKNDLVPDIT